MRLTLISILVLALSVSQAQNLLNRNNKIPVIVNGDSLELPWASGLNSAQVSQIDLNNDGKLDLYLFEANNEYNPISGDKAYMFINQGGNGEVKYKFQPSYRGSFPILEDYTLLRDYNCDGKPDIFTWSVLQRFKVYKNTSTSTEITFELEKKVLYTDTTELPNQGNYYHPGAISWNYFDMPSIADIDGDGDLDILTTATNGHFMEYNKNMSQEYYGNCDSLTFKLKNTCWGRYFEDTNHIVMDTCDIINVTNPESKSKQIGGEFQQNKAGLHSSDAILAIDLNGDGVMDILEGDAGRNEVYSFINGGKKDSSHIVSMTQAYPPNDSFHVSIYGLPFHLDVDNDSKKDLIISVGMDRLKDTESIWYYKNTSATNVPNFVLQDKGFLQNEMIDVGTQSKPVFFDYNQDSLLDLVIGNFGYFDELGLVWNKSKYRSQLALFKNIGTKEEPIFELVDSNFVDLPSIPLNLAGNKAVFACHPTFGDLDNDGDEDMIIGDHRGKIHYFENIPNVNNEAEFYLVNAELKNIDVGDFSTPQLYDLDEDGNLDLIIGESRGTMKYYRNISASSLNFVLEDDTLGNINVRDDWDVVGYSTPFIYKDSIGDTKLISGSKPGYFRYFDSVIVGDTISKKFRFLEKRYQEIWDGIYSSINGADIDNDGQIDFIVGNQSGGVVMYTSGDTAYKPGIFESGAMENLKVDLFPNPANNEIRIRIDCDCQDQFTYSVYSVIGNLLLEKIDDSDVLLPISDFEPGLYVVKAQNKNRSIIITERFIKSK